ncbi:type II-A CRISPR-associated protein Csn2 [Fructobacillus ficulneus]|uniref:CRISPR-associated protein, SAG0897 family n=1 Tax=Fructobacillus ficulneus TaxID=157463 RepID=A0A0K8MHH9_9LACO|nr:type II-A CRISPR-associated protein Csn2 [Fructobacillus ficulneus]GAO99996.1 hypothetical protein FFIC_270280 [Fructobacillus ficulneus]
MNLGQISLETVGTIQIEEGLNLITMADPNLYGRTVYAIQNGINDKVVYSENNRPETLSKRGLFIGDPVSGTDVRTHYSKFIDGILTKNISEEGLDKLFHINMQVQSILAEEIIDSNLPLKIEGEWQLEKLLKSQNISVERANTQSIFGKIEDVVHVMGMLDESRYLLVTNLTLYCDMSELNQLHQCLLAEGINLISLNLSQENPIFGETFKTSYIDHDFVLF